MKDKKDYLINKYGEKDADIVIVLEEYAKQLNEKLDDESFKINFEEMFDFIDSLSDSIESIYKYAEYLRGAALPFYDEQLKEEDLITENNYIEEALHGSVDWLSVEKKLKIWYSHPENKIYDDEFCLIKYSLSPKLQKYFDQSKYPWAMAIGYWHHWHIKKHRETVKLMPLDLEKSIKKKKYVKKKKLPKNEGR